MAISGTASRTARTASTAKRALRSGEPPYSSSRPLMRALEKLPTMRSP